MPALYEASNREARSREVLRWLDGIAGQKCGIGTSLLASLQYSCPHYPPRFYSSWGLESVRQGARIFRAANAGRIAA